MCVHGRACMCSRVSENERQQAVRGQRICLWLNGRQGSGGDQRPSARLQESHARLDCWLLHFPRCFDIIAQEKLLRLPCSLLIARRSPFSPTTNVHCFLPVEQLRSAPKLTDLDQHPRLPLRLMTHTVPHAQHFARQHNQLHRAAYTQHQRD